MKIFGITGAVGVGKTESCNFLLKKFPNIKQFEISRHLKLITDLLFPTVISEKDKEKRLSKPGLKSQTVRDFLIQFSTLMKSFDKDYWIKQIDKFADEEIVIVNALRFKHEYEYLCYEYGKKNIFVLEITAEKDKTPKTNDIVENIPISGTLYNNYDKQFYDDVLHIFTTFLSKKCKKDF